MRSGWVKLHRCFLASSIWKNVNLTRFWIWCLLKASHARNKTRVRYIEVELAPGQFVFGRQMAAKETGMTEDEIRTCVKALKMENAIDVASHSTRQFSVLSVVKWERYQVAEANAPRPFAGEPPGRPPPGPTINNDQEDQERVCAPPPSPPPPSSPYHEIPESLYRVARTALNWMTPEPPLNALLMDFPAWWIEEAAKEAALGGETSANYVRGILRRYQKNGGPSKHGERQAGEPGAAGRKRGRRAAGGGKYADLDAANFGH